MTFADIVYKSIVPFINGSVIPVLYAFAFFFFLFGLFKFFFTGGEENREQGRTFALWGFVGFVVLFSLWGIVRLLLSTLVAP